MLPLIETRSGIGFWPLDPRSEDIKITDIAHSLSQQCRFSGHTRVYYSVAEHCVRVSELLESWDCDRAMQLWGLLHDASEAYLVDIPAPLKGQPDFAGYRTAEAKIMNCVCHAFDLPCFQPHEVHAADGVLLATEARDLMAYRPEHWVKLTREPLPDVIVPWDCATAKRSFLARFDALTEHDTDPPMSTDVPTARPTGDEQ